MTELQKALAQYLSDLKAVQEACEATVSMLEEQLGLEMGIFREVNAAMVDAQKLWQRVRPPGENDIPF